MSKKNILEAMAKEKAKETREIKNHTKVGSSEQVDNAIIRDGETKEVKRETTLFKLIFNLACDSRIATKENAQTLREMENALLTLQKGCNVLKDIACENVTRIAKAQNERDNEGKAIKDAHTYKDRAIRYASTYKTLFDGTQKAKKVDNVLSRENLFNLPTLRDAYKAIVNAIPTSKFYEEEAKRIEEEAKRIRIEEEKKATIERLSNDFPQFAFMFEDMLSRMSEDEIRAMFAKAK